MARPPMLREVGDGVFVWEHDVADPFTSNVGVVIEDDSLTLIDAGARPSSYLPLRDRLGELRRPVTTVVLTHAHADHGAGLAAFPEAEVVAGAPQPDVVPLVVPLDVLRGLFPAVAHELTEAVDPVPTRLVDRPTVLGRLDLVVMSGHSPSDIVASVVDDDVCFTGDLCIFGQTPMGVGADFEQWEVSLDWLPVVGTYVPGHGPPGTAADVRRLQDYLVAVVDAARCGVPLVAGPWDRWWHPWRDHEPDAVDHLNVEQVLDPAKLPPTLLRLAGR